VSSRSRISTQLEAGCVYRRPNVVVQVKQRSSGSLPNDKTQEALFQKRHRLEELSHRSTFETFPESFLPGPPIHVRPTLHPIIDDSRGIIRR
jgi:hypothetical protein